MVELKSSFLWYITQRFVIATTDVSDTFRSHLRGPSSPSCLTVEETLTIEVASSNLPHPSHTYRVNLNI